MMENNRRHFIKKTGLAAGVLINPFENIFPITKKAVEENPIIGHGDFRYQVDKKWGVQDPSQFPVNDCHEMVIDRKDRIFMTTTHPKNNILIYDRGGKILGSWGTEYPGAHGLTLSEEGNEAKDEDWDGALDNDWETPKDIGIKAEVEWEDVINIED